VVGRAVWVRARGAEVRVCAPPDEEVAERLAGVGVPLAPVGQPMRPLVHGSRFRAAADVPRRAAEGCDAPVATGVMPAGGWQ
jgi:vancomycin aglycone glucosyltransferase